MWISVQIHQMVHLLMQMVALNLRLFDMGLRVIKCPGCYSSKTSPIHQCRNCGYVSCKKCRIGGGIFASSRCPKCDSKYAEIVGKIV